MQIMNLARIIFACTLAAQVLGGGFDPAVHTAGVLPTLCSMQREQSLCYDGFTQSELKDFCDVKAAGHAKAKHLLQTAYRPCEQYVIQDRIAYWAKIRTVYGELKPNFIIAEKVKEYLSAQRCTHASCGLQAFSSTESAKLLKNHLPVALATQTSAMLFLAGKAVVKCLPPNPPPVPKPTNPKAKPLSPGAKAEQQLKSLEEEALKCTKPEDPLPDDLTTCLKAQKLPANFPPDQQDLWVKLAKQSVCRCIAALIRDRSIEPPSYSQLKLYLTGNNVEKLCSTGAVAKTKRKQQWIAEAPAKAISDAEKQLLRNKDPLQPDPKAKEAAVKLNEKNAKEDAAKAAAAVKAAEAAEEQETNPQLTKEQQEQLAEIEAAIASGYFHIEH